MGVEIVCGFKLLRELGGRALPAYAAIDPKPRRPEDALCVVERLGRDPERAAEGAEAAAAFLRDAKRLTQLRHPNLVRVRDVVVGPTAVLLVTDWVDGEVLSDIQRIAARQAVPIPLAGGLRVILDLLEGLSALHEVRDAKREPLQLVHAEVAPRNIVVGVDGRAVLVHPLRAPAGATRSHASEVAGYLAPEVLLGDQTADQRADVYGAGVLLWEALSGRRMHPEGEDVGEIVMRLLGGRVEAPSTPIDAPWAAPLVEIAKRAVSPDPSFRFANATAMLADVRRVVGARLAPKLTVAALVEAVAGERIRARPAQLGVVRSVARLPSESAWTTETRASSSPGERNEQGEQDEGEPTKPAPSVASPSSQRSPASGRKSGPPASAHPSIPVIEAAPVPSSDPPSSAEVVEFLEEHEAPARFRPPPPPRAPPPAPPLSVIAARGTPPPAPVAPRTPARTLRPELVSSDSKTDMAAAIAPVVAAASTKAKTTWTIAFACALGTGAITWMLLRDPGEAARSADAPASSLAQSASEPSAAAAPSSLSPSSTIAAGTAADGHGNPSPPAAAADRPTRPPPLPNAPPIPTVTAPPAPPSPAAPAPAPATSTHPKKRVYDPMGI